MAELTFVKIAKRNKGLYVALAGLLIGAIVINFATGVNFFKISNLLNVTRSFCILGIASIKQAIDIPVIGAGYSYLRDGRNKLPGEDPTEKSSVYWAEKNVKENKVDLVGIARQAIADPALPKKILNGDLKSVNWCTMCMDCGMLLGEQQEVGCSVYDRYYKELAKKIKAEP